MTHLRLSATTLFKAQPVLVVLESAPAVALRLSVHSEDAIFGNRLADELKAVLRP